MLTSEDIAAAVKARIDATSGFSTALPGGAWYGRGPDTPADYPYAVFDITPETASLTFSAHYLQVFNVSIAAHCPIGIGTPSVQTVEQFLHTALATEAADTALRASTFRNTGEKIKSCIPMTADGDYADKLRSARDVYAVGPTVKITALGLKDVS